MSQHFINSQLTPNNTSLFLNEEERTISLFQRGERVTCQQFTELEWRILFLLFRENKRGFSYEEGLVAYTGETLDVCHERLLEAEKQDEFHEERKQSTVFILMKAVRETLIVCQERLHALGLHSCSISGFGYTIIPYKREDA